MWPEIEGTLVFGNFRRSVLDLSVFDLEHVAGDTNWVCL
jgi:hypothetical protein